MCIKVLDDNRELFIPETHQVVKAHPHFLLFGTQNPPGQYGGRKVCCYTSLGCISGMLQMNCFYAGSVSSIS